MRPRPVRGGARAGSRSIHVDVHVIALGVDPEARSQLTCIAEQSGGALREAKSENGLRQALDEVATVIAATVTPVPPGQRPRTVASTRRSRHPLQRPVPPAAPIAPEPQPATATAPPTLALTRTGTPTVALTATGTRPSCHSHARPPWPHPPPTRARPTSNRSGRSTCERPRQNYPIIGQVQVGDR